MDDSVPPAERRRAGIYFACLGALVAGVVGLGVWSLAATGETHTDRPVVAGAEAAPTDPPPPSGTYSRAPVERLPTDSGNFDDSDLVLKLLADSIEQGGLRLGMSCQDEPGAAPSDDVPPFMAVARSVDGECVVGGWVSRGQVAPMVFGPEEARTELGWQRPWDSIPIFDDKGRIIGDMSTGSPVYFEESTGEERGE